MRWEALFDDLEAQLRAVESAERRSTVADLTRAEHATIALVDRLRGTRTDVGIDLGDGSRVQGTVVDATTEWVLVGERHRRHLVPLPAIDSVTGVGPYAAPGGPGLRTRRLGLTHALRALMRDRRPVQVRTWAALYPGWIARVGRDHLDLESAPGAIERARTVPCSAVLCVSDSDAGSGPR